jgi:hypothetical protein
MSIIAELVPSHDGAGGDAPGRARIAVEERLDEKPGT